MALNITKDLSGDSLELVLDGRNYKVPGYEGGFFVGPTILDKVKPGMTVGDREIFGPVTVIKRVKTFEEGLAIIRHSASHIMALAVRRLFPETKIAIGPSTADGYYYDFDSTHRFNEEDFAAIILRE